VSARWLAGLLSLVLVTGGCSDDSGETAGSVPTGGASSGGSSAGGSASGGTSSGGSASGGTAGTPTTDAGTDATDDAPSADASSTSVTLLDQPGDVFTPTVAETVLSLAFGNKGTVYTSVQLDFDVLVGDWQPEIPDPGTPDRTEHILFGLFRANQTQSDQRYLMGSAAVTFATKAPHFRMFGRNSIGQGYTTYTSWSTTYGWQKGKLYHLSCSLDGVAHIQRCELTLAGQLVKALQGDVAYLDPAAHLSSGFYVELGTGKPGDIEASPLGWQFSNLKITATLAP
jgi:hypothetical protein